MVYEIPNSLIYLIEKDLTRAQRTVLKGLAEGTSLCRVGTLTMNTTLNYQYSDGGSIPANVVDKLVRLGLALLEPTNRNTVRVEATPLGLEVFAIGAGHE